jgi:hypothetical protein
MVYIVDSLMLAVRLSFLGGMKPMGSKPKQTAEQKELEQISIEREKQLRVENARETTKSFGDNLAFRQKLRGIFSLLSGGFKGFPGALGVSGTGASGSGSGGGGGGSVSGIGGGGTQPRGGGGGGGGDQAPRGRPGRDYR